jgi:hypothetical protein
MPSVGDREGVWCAVSNRLDEFGCTVSAYDLDARMLLQPPFYRFRGRVRQDVHYAMLLEID